MKIIGIYGVMGSGKSIFAEAFPLAHEQLKGFGYNLVYTSLSAKMKRDVSDITGVQMNTGLPWVKHYTATNAGSDFSAEDKAKYIPRFDTTVGILLQRYGYQMKQVFGDRFWADELIGGLLAKNSIQAQKISVAIVDGVRYLSDVQVIREAGGDVIKIERIGTGGQENESRDSKHIGETELLDYKFDYVLPNQTVYDNGLTSKEKLRAVAVQQMVNTIIARYK